GNFSRCQHFIDDDIAVCFVIHNIQISLECGFSYCHIHHPNTVPVKSWRFRPKSFAAVFFFPASCTSVISTASSAVATEMPSSSFVSISPAGLFVFLPVSFAPYNLNLLPPSIV